MLASRDCAERTLATASAPLAHTRAVSATHLYHAHAAYPPAAAAAATSTRRRRRAAGVDIGREGKACPCARSLQGD